MNMCLLSNKRWTTGFYKYAQTFKKIVDIFIINIYISNTIALKNIFFQMPI